MRVASKPMKVLVCVSKGQYLLFRLLSLYPVLHADELKSSENAYNAKFTEICLKEAF